MSGAPERGAAAGAVDAFVGLGANAGARLQALRQAVAAMARLEGTEVVAASAVFETEAHVLPGAAPQPDHLNAVAQLRTTLAPDVLLAALHAIERAAGRDPAAPRWSARPLDLDLLLYGDLVADADAPRLPHPRLAERRFVLAPLAELAPERAVPGTGRTVAALLARTADRAAVRRTDHRIVG